MGSILYRHSWSNCKLVLGRPNFTTRFDRGTEDTEGDNSFPLPGDGPPKWDASNGKGKTPVDRFKKG